MIRHCIGRYKHSIDVIMSVVASQITGVSIVYSNVCSGADQRKYQGSVSLIFVRGIHRSLMNSMHKGPVTRKMFPFDDVIMMMYRRQILFNSQKTLRYSPSNCRDMECPVFVFGKWIKFTIFSKHIATLRRLNFVFVNRVPPICSPLFITK